MWGRALGGIFRLSGVAKKQENKLNHKDDHYKDFQNEGSGLMELPDHEFIKTGSGTKFLFDEGTVVKYAHLGRCQLVKARRKHVAEELYRVLRPFSELS